MRPSRTAFLFAAALAITACSNPTTLLESPDRLVETTRLNVSDPRGGNTMGSGNFAGTADSTVPGSSEERGGNTLGSGNHHETIESTANVAPTTDSVSVGVSDPRGGNTMGSGH